MPLPAAVPKSSVTVPWRVPVPLVRVSVTVRLAPSPTVELLLNVSWVRITGWTPKTDPATAPPGRIVKTILLTAAGVTVSTCVADVRPATAPVMVGVPAVLSR